MPDYWWYVARADLLEAALRLHVEGAALALDLGSADGPSAAWFRESAQRTVVARHRPPRAGGRRRVRLGAGPAVRRRSLRHGVGLRRHRALRARGHRPGRGRRVLRPGGRSSCPCRPTSGPGATSTSPTATTGGTPGPGRARGRGCRVPGRAGDLRLRHGLPDVRGRAAGPQGAARQARPGPSTSSRSPSCPQPLNRALLGLSRVDRAVLRSGTCRSGRRCSSPPPSAERLQRRGACTRSDQHVGSCPHSGRVALASGTHRQ